MRLSGIVERVCRVEDRCPRNSATTICPDGCAEIVIHLADPMRSQPRHLLVGQMERPLSVMPAGAVLMVGARLSPTGLFRLLRMPQQRVAGQIVALDSVWAAWTRHTAQRLGEVAGAEDQLNAFERALEALAPDPADVDRSVELAIRVMRARGGPVDYDRVAAASGTSRRQFERRFRECVGLPPHLFGRIVRFQKAFAAIGREPGAALAARLGYVDQPHLVREVRRFSDCSPTLLSGAEGLTAFFAR